MQLDSICQIVVGLSELKTTRDELSRIKMTKNSNITSENTSVVIFLLLILPIIFVFCWNFCWKLKSDLRPLLVHSVLDDVCPHPRPSSI